MKAAVMYQKDGLPQYTDFPEPKAQNEDEVIATVKAVAIKHIDKSKASGRHYSSEVIKENGRVIGGDGVCLLDNGTRVYGIGISGMMAEKATINRRQIVQIPAELDDVTASALPNAVIGAAMALKFKAEIKTGDVVLINGATGFTGRVAVQIAKHYGAKKVIVTGRNQQSLNDLLSLGADETISLLENNETISAQIKALHSNTPVNVIIDYLWGHTAEIILGCIKGDGSFTGRIRYVSIGSMGGDLIQLSAAALRSVDLQLTGSGLGAWSKQQVDTLFSEILPEMFQLAATGRLKIKTTAVKLEDVEKLWDIDVPNGERLVVII